MKIKDLIEKLNLNYTGDDIALDREINGAYCGDLLSWVMGNGKQGNIWLTVQGHINIIAVSTLREFSGIIIAEGAAANPDTLEKAAQEHIAIITTDLTVYEMAKKLVELGI